MKRKRRNNVVKLRIPAKAWKDAYNLSVKKRKGRPKGSTKASMRKRRMREVRKALKTLRKLVPLLAA